MKKILLVLFLFLTPALCWADEYVLVMSKEDNVCQHMLKLYNDDLKKYGKINYDRHKEFNDIAWVDKKYFYMKGGKKQYPMTPSEPDKVLMSRFDINNDGKEEIVLKDEAVTIRGIDGEGLYYFQEPDSEYFKDDINIDILKRASGRLATTVGDVYNLKELPQFLYLGIGDKESKAYYSLGRYLYFHPFFFEKLYYLDTKDEVPTDPHGIYSGKFLIILKYTHDNQPKDTCYFLKTTDCKESKRR